MSCRLVFDSQNGGEAHGGIAAGAGVGDRGRGFIETGDGSALSHGAGEARRYCWPTGIPSFFAGGPRLGAASSDRAALRRAGGGLGSVGGDL